MSGKKSFPPVGSQAGAWEPDKMRLIIDAAGCRERSTRSYRIEPTGAALFLTFNYGWNTHLFRNGLRLLLRKLFQRPRDVGQLGSALGAEVDIDLLLLHVTLGFRAIHALDVLEGLFDLGLVVGG